MTVDESMSGMPVGSKFMQIIALVSEEGVNMRTRRPSRLHGHSCLAVDSLFFFQAEDGIRDLTVTGVQTCALPIYGAGGVDGRPQDPLRLEEVSAHARRKIVALQLPLQPGGEQSLLPRPYDSAVVGVAAESRSEERRVGKECRSRWSPYH